jgi:hypothetical protein
VRTIGRPVVYPHAVAQYLFARHKTIEGNHGARPPTRRSRGRSADKAGSAPLSSTLEVSIRMGQPTKESPDAILDMHLKTVGILVNVAATCDLILFNAFRVVSGCESKIANAIYFSFESLQTKKNIVTRVLRANGDSNETKIVEAIISATEKANNKRNEISHALLQAEGNQILALNARQQGKPDKPVTLNISMISTAKPPKLMFLLFVNINFYARSAEYLHQ